MSESSAFNIDCMEYMKALPDNAFDLAVVDPPYGGAKGVHAQRNHKTKVVETEGGISVSRTGGTWAYKYGTTINEWDVAPSREYFEELFRVSRNQIIWGGNYFSLPPTRCFLVWKKISISEAFTMAMAEYAWTSFDSNAKVFEYPPQGEKGDERFHPTQKPIALYKWIFNKYAKEGDRILDTHLGSGSSRIAAYDLGLDFVGCEIDKSYFDKQERRFKEYTSQPALFLSGPQGEKKGEALF